MKGIKKGLTLLGVAALMNGQSVFLNHVWAEEQPVTPAVQSQTRETETVPINLINGDFEEPVNSSMNPIYPHQSEVPGWSTTASDGKIEVWSSNNYYGISPYSGQFVELMATQKSALYQDIDTKPGSYVYWEVAHI